MALRRSTPKRVNSATNRYLDEVIARLTLPSDYALADVLGISTQAIYKMRGGGMMSAATAAKVAHILKLDALRVIAETELERGADDVFWKRIRDAAVVAALAIGAASFGVAPLPAQASPAGAALNITLTLNTHWQRNRRREAAYGAFWRALAARLGIR